MRVEALVNQTEFGRLLGVSREFVRQLRTGMRPGPPFPLPVYQGREMLWRKVDVDAYVEERKKYLVRGDTCES